MKGKEIIQEIQQRFHIVTKLSRKVMVQFERDAIHELRIELKKMHAFLSLLRVEAGNRDALKFKKRLKALNGYVGIIHNIQLHQHYINSILPLHVPPGITDYLNILHEDIERWKKELVTLMSEHTALEEEKNIILNALPENISKSAIRKYLSLKVDEIKTLLILATSEEHNLHALRKVLRDILYNWSYIKPEAESMLPKDLNTYNNIQAVTELLGLYGDQCLSLDFLQPIHTDKLGDEAARELLQSVRLQLEKRKKELNNEFFILLLRFHGISLPNVKSKLLSWYEQSQSRL